ncbi:had-superfamily subfamily variant 1 [Apiospora saccharicola]
MSGKRRHAPDSRYDSASKRSRMANTMESLSRLDACHIVGAPGSGSTLLMKILAESKSCAVPCRLLPKDASMSEAEFVPWDFISRENYTLSSASVEGEQVVVYAVEPCSDFYHDEVYVNLDKCDPSSLAYSGPFPRILGSPIFCIRDPIRVLDLWKKDERMEWQGLVHCLNMFYRLWDLWPDPKICVLYKALAEYPCEVIPVICDHLEIPFTYNMTRPTKFSIPFLRRGVEEVSLYRPLHSLEAFSESKEDYGIVQDEPYYDLFTNYEKDMLESMVGHRYISYWGDSVRVLRETLLEKTWIAFDLDDALHEYRRASSKATNTTLKYFHQISRVPLSDLRSAYSDIDGSTSTECIEDCFSFLADRFSFELAFEEKNHLLQLYEDTITDGLELKSGALRLLATLNGLGKKLAIISEGLHDAHERNLNLLGLEDPFDFIVTSNGARRGKTDGLFQEVLDDLKISASDMAYIGDSEERDMKPAMELGIFCIHFSERKNCNLESHPPRINTLNKLNHILRG